MLRYFQNIEILPSTTVRRYNQRKAYAIGLLGHSQECKAVGEGSGAETAKLVQRLTTHYTSLSSFGHHTN